VAARRLRILEAAARCFAKGGFARTRMEDVAAEARVSRALVHHHFGSKEELARQVQEHMLEEWSAAVDQAIAGAPSAGDALAAWLRVNLADLRRRPLLHAILADAAILGAKIWKETARTRGQEPVTCHRLALTFPSLHNDGGAGAITLPRRPARSRIRQRPAR